MRTEAVPSPPTRSRTHRHICNIHESTVFLLDIECFDQEHGVENKKNANEFEFGVFHHHPPHTKG